MRKVPILSMVPNYAPDDSNDNYLTEKTSMQN